MEITKIDKESFGMRGIWRKTDIRNWVKTQSVKYKNNAIAVGLLEFYKQFYNGSKVIKYVGYYSRMHLMNAMKDLKIDGVVEQSKQTLKIRFD